MSKKWIFLVKIQNTEILSKNTGIQNIFLISNTKYRNTKYRNTKYSYIWRLSKNIKYIWRLSKNIAIFGVEDKKNIDIFIVFNKLSNYPKIVKTWIGMICASDHSANVLKGYTRQGFLWGGECRASGLRGECWSEDSNMGQDGIELLHKNDFFCCIHSWHPHTGWRHTSQALWINIGVQSHRSSRNC